MGADGPTGCAQRRLWHILGGTGIWAGAPPARSTYTLHRSGRRRSGDALPTRLTGDFNQMGRIPAQLEGATHVYVLNGSKPLPLSPLYSGPYVVRRHGPKYFDIFIGGRLETISVDRIKLHRGRAVPVPAAPPVRVRPKRV
jgi:hypothetical protein